jgi:hypothetical protein
VHVVERKTAVPSQCGPETLEVLVRDRVLDAQTRGGAATHAGGALCARVGSYQPAIVEETLRLTVLSSRGLLRHDRLPVGEQLAQRVVARAIVEDLAHAAAGGAEGCLQPVGVCEPGQVARPLDGTPRRLRDVELVKQPGEGELALYPRERPALGHSHRHPIRQQRARRGQQPCLLVRRQHDVDCSRGDHPLEEVEVCDGISAGRRAAMHSPDPPAEAHETERVGVENLDPVAKRPEAADNLTRCEAGPLCQ